MLAAGLSSSVAFAQPFQVDTRPPLNNTQPVSQATNSPMNITINIQASNQNPQQLADTIRREIEKVQRQQEVQRRSRLFDKEWKVIIKKAKKNIERAYNVHL